MRELEQTSKSNVFRGISEDGKIEFYLYSSETDSFTCIGRRWSDSDFDDVVKSINPANDNQIEDRLLYSTALKMCAKAKSRSQKKGVPYSINADWFVSEVRTSNQKCPLTDIRFTYKNKSGSFMNPYRPSIDRIIPELGYVPENCRVVILGINMMMSDWGYEIMADIAEAAAIKHAKQPHQNPHKNRTQAAYSVVNG